MKATNCFRLLTGIGYCADTVWWTPQQQFLDWRGRPKWKNIHESFVMNYKAAVKYLDSISPGWEKTVNEREEMEDRTKQYMKRWDGLMRVKK